MRVLRRGFKCKQELIKLLKENYCSIVEREYNEDYIFALTRFDEISENRLRNLLLNFYDNPKSRNQAWRSCKGELYEYAVFKALNQVISHNKKLSKKLDILIGDEALLQHKDKIVIKNWSEIYPDVDILVIEKQTGNVKAIISCKTSLRERLTETAFWKRELERRESTKNVKLLFVTTDKDNELKIDTNRYIILHVIDCTFVTNPEKYKQLIKAYEEKYGERKDFKILLSKVRKFSEIAEYLENL